MVKFKEVSYVVPIDWASVVQTYQRFSINIPLKTKLMKIKFYPTNHEFPGVFVCENHKQFNKANLTGISIDSQMSREVKKTLGWVEPTEGEVALNINGTKFMDPTFSDAKKIMYLSYFSKTVTPVKIKPFKMKSSSGPTPKLPEELLLYIDNMAMSDVNKKKVKKKVKEIMMSIIKNKKFIDARDIFMKKIELRGGGDSDSVFLQQKDHKKDVIYSGTEKHTFELTAKIKHVLKKYFAYFYLLQTGLEPSPEADVDIEITKFREKMKFLEDYAAKFMKTFDSLNIVYFVPLESKIRSLDTLNTPRHGKLIMDVSFYF